MTLDDLKVRFKVIDTVNAAKLTKCVRDIKYRDQIGRITSKIIPRLISLVFSVCMDCNIMDLLEREHHEILAEIEVRQIARFLLIYTLCPRKKL